MIPSRKLIFVDAPHTRVHTHLYGLHNPPCAGRWVIFYGSVLLWVLRGERKVFQGREGILLGYWGRIEVVNSKELGGIVLRVNKV